MSDDGIESKVPNLEGMTLEQIRRDPRLQAAAEQLVGELLGYPDDGVIICCQPLEVEVSGSGSDRKKRRH